jgi:hypothetical protein
MMQVSGRRSCGARGLGRPGECERLLDPFGLVLTWPVVAVYLRHRRPGFAGGGFGAEIAAEIQAAPCVR